MQFELLHLSLLDRLQIDAFEARTAAGEPFSRERWLRFVFSSRIEFQHRRDAFHYVPEPNAGDEILAGRIGRQIIVQENEPPESGLQDTQRESWRATVVLIDPRPHAEGQKAAVEDKPSIGRPVALMESLVRHINSRADPPTPFILEITPLSDPADFWEFVKANKGEITSVIFDLIAPNMFGMETDYDRELRDMKEKEKIRRAKLEIENRDGLELETDRVRGAVEYASKGGGSIRARTKGTSEVQFKSPCPAS